MTNILFPHNLFWHFQAPNADELIEFLESNDGTSIPRDWGELCAVDTFYYDSKLYKQISHLLLPSLTEFGRGLNINSDHKLNIRLDECWVNHYHLGAFQEPHDHDAVDLVSVFFMNDGDNFADFYFWDRDKCQVSKKFWRDIFNYSNHHMPYPKKGDIIFLPSYTIHGVTVHKSEIVRKTFACNYFATLEK